jgi:hypothetical protein
VSAGRGDVTRGTPPKLTFTGQEALDAGATVEELEQLTPLTPEQYRELKLQEYREMGLTEPPGDFLRYRLSRLEGPGTVRQQQNDDGCWDVVLLIDGSYTSRADAEEVAATFQAEIHGLAQQIRRAETQTEK